MKTEESNETTEVIFWTGDDANLQPILDYCDRITERPAGVATALEAFQSEAKPHSDKRVDAFYSALRLHGAAGQLGACMILAQRSHDRLKRVKEREIVDPQYEKLKRNRNNYAVERLRTFALQEESRLNIIVKQFKYGMRITLRHEAVIRFRRKTKKRRLKQGE